MHGLLWLRQRRLLLAITLVVAIVLPLSEVSRDAAIAGPGSWQAAPPAHATSPWPAAPSVQSLTPRAYLPLVYSPRIVTDDFSNTGSGWPVAEDEVFVAGYADGEYRIFVKQERHVVLVGRGLVARDFHVEVDARAAGHPDGLYGLYFARGQAGLYLYEVANGEYGLWRYDEDASGLTFTTLIDITAHPAIRSGHQTNRLKVVRTGSLIELYANGQKVGSKNDSALGEGDVGLVAEAVEDGFEARFDNFLMAFGPSGSTAQAVGQPSPAGPEQIEAIPAPPR